MLLPNEHLNMLIELLKPSGPELARRWLSALMLVPEDLRGQVVDAVESQIVADYASDD